MQSDDLIGASGEWDEDGFHLRLAGDETESHYRTGDLTVARELLAALEPLRGWVAEADAQRRAYDAASPEERAAVLGAPIVDPGEALRDRADYQRKHERENPVTTRDNP